MTHIFCDMDGVLVDFLQAALQAFQPDMYPGPNERVDVVSFMQDAKEKLPGKHPFRQLEHALGVDIQGFWDRINKGGMQFWARMPEFEWTKHLWGRLQDIGTPILLTSPPTGKSASPAAAGKYEWARCHLGDEAVRSMIVCPAHLKQVFAPGNILIDDREDTCEQWKAAGGYAYRFKSIQVDGVHPLLSDVDVMLDSIRLTCDSARATG